MAEADAAQPGRLEVSLKIGGEPLSFSGELPPGSVSLEELLPLLWNLGDAITDAGIRAEAREGRAISCRKGCGACCRQPVPIAPAEARRIVALVEGLPEARRGSLLARFEGIRRRLEEAGLLDRIAAPLKTRDDRQDFGLDYFQLGLACPFLEEESCSIHPQRPLACREYLVTSPAEECARPGPEKVRMVPMRAKVWPALAALEAADDQVPWTLLSLAPSWVEAHPDPGLRGEGSDLLRRILQGMRPPGSP